MSSHQPFPHCQQRRFDKFKLGRCPTALNILEESTVKIIRKSSDNNSSSMSNNSINYEDLFSSLVSDIKYYNGKDPLLPWLRGIRKMRDSLPTQLLKEKLPRFLQKCAQTFLSDRRYTNDLRYLRVWIQLMDFVDEPKTVLKTIEANRIGMKKSLFYQAYALYYEKMKKFEAAERMYLLGVQNLAEPVNELQKSFEQFLCRMERHKNKKKQGIISRKVPPISSKNNHTRYSNENMCNNEVDPKGSWPMESMGKYPSCSNVEGNQLLSQRYNQETSGKAKIAHPLANFSDVRIANSNSKTALNQLGCKSNSGNTKAEADKNEKFYSDDTVVVKFVDTAVVGKSGAEDARHHGLVEPTVNTKEVMDAINDMFREPLEPSLSRKRSCRNQHEADMIKKNGVGALVDEKIGTHSVPSCENLMKAPACEMGDPKVHLTAREPLQIFVDEVENDGTKEMMDQHDELDQNSDCDSTEDEHMSGGSFNGLVFPCPLDVSSECSKDPEALKPNHTRLIREDTVVHMFVGSTILDDPKVENVCHHGLVEPTINLKEAMDDINNMFGKPIEFARKSRPKKQELNHKKFNSGSFLILPDDDLECPSALTVPNSSVRKEKDLFEQTVCTREAIDEINKMFGMPL